MVNKNWKILGICSWKYKQSNKDPIYKQIFIQILHLFVNLLNLGFLEKFPIVLKETQYFGNIYLEDQKFCM